MKNTITLIAAGVLLASGCTSMSVDEFKSDGPAFLLEEFFEGKTRARGLFEDRGGNVRRQFVVDITGQWDGKTLTLTEDFRYSDGETETRQWKIKKTNLRHSLMIGEVQLNKSMTSVLSVFKLLNQTPITKLAV